jgi:hypothetical protein
MPVSQSAPRLFIGSLVKHDAAFANLNGLDALTKREAVRFPAKLASSVDNLILPFRAKHPCPSILYFLRQNSSLPWNSHHICGNINLFCSSLAWKDNFSLSPFGTADLRRLSLSAGSLGPISGAGAPQESQLTAVYMETQTHRAAARVNVRVFASSGSQVYISLLPHCPRNHLYTGEEDEKIIIIIAACT